MIREFSGGYYRAEMDVQPVDRGPIIDPGLFYLLNERIYEDSDSLPVMRLTLNRGPHFVPEPENGVPTNVIGLPEDIIDASQDGSVTESANIFVLKPSAAERYQSSIGQSTYERSH